MIQHKMFGFIKKVFVIAMTFFSWNALKCVSMNNQECKIRPVVMNINSNETLFYPYNILVNKCSGSCNDVNNFCIKLYVPKGWLDVSVCNDKQRWNKDKCRSEYKELIDKERCDEGFIENPSKYECDKSCDVG